MESITGSLYTQMPYPAIDPTKSIRKVIKLPDGFVVGIIYGRFTPIFKLIRRNDQYPGVQKRVIPGASRAGNDQHEINRAKLDRVREVSGESASG